MRRRLRTEKELLAAILAGLLAAESLTVVSLGELVHAARDVELAGLLAAHREETRGHVRRLLRAQGSVGHHLPRHVPHGTLGLRLEAQVQLASDLPSPELRDRIVAACASRAEHDEVGRYRHALLLARATEEHAAAACLARTLAEEERALADVERIAARLAGAPVPA